MTGMEMMLKSFGVNPDMFRQVAEAVKQMAENSRLTRESQERMELAQRVMCGKLDKLLARSVDPALIRTGSNGRTP
jgi:hypothetical protein